MTIGNFFSGTVAVFHRVSAFSKRGALAALLVLPSAVSATGSPAEMISYKSLQAPNAWLPDAIGFQNAYEVQQKMRHAGSWSRILMVNSGARAGAAAHAFCVFALDGKLWAYDQEAGCRRVWLSVTDRADAMKVGRVLAPGQFDRAVWVDQSF
jgi:hypothetical protein